MTQPAVDAPTGTGAEVPEDQTDESPASGTSNAAVPAVDDEPDPSDLDPDDELEPSTPPAASRMSPTRAGAIIGLAAIVALAGVGAWLGYRAYQAHQAERQYQLFLQVGRQGAVDLTTIDWTHPEADVQRILDASTGSFQSDFSARSQPFIDTVKKLQSKSVGTVTDAGIDSSSAEGADVLVAMSVKTQIGDQPQQEPRSWRMRISVQRIGKDDAKVSNVAFVP
jgi:Mce-associated membrane protein